MRAQRFGVGVSFFLVSYLIVICLGCGATLPDGVDPGSGGTDILGEFVGDPNDPNSPSAVSHGIVCLSGKISEVSLSGHSPSGKPLSFDIAEEPDNGALGLVQQVDESSATVTYQSDPGFSGMDQFTYIATQSDNISALAVVTVFVVPVEITYSVEYNPGERPLTVTCSAPSMPFDGSLEGTYTWTVDGIEHSGPTATHAERTFVLKTAGIHIITLSLAIPGMVPVSCVNSNTNTGEIYITVRPRVTGHVYDADGIGIAGATLSTSSGATAVTDQSGYYALLVPYEFSGALMVQHNQYTFPENTRLYTSLTEDAQGQDFHAQPGGATLNVTISGHVQLASGQALVGATVAAQGTGDFENHNSFTSTAQDGSYQMALPVGWTGTLWALKDGYRMSPLLVPISALQSDLSDKDFTATPNDGATALISGRVTDAQGQGIADVTITASNNGGTTTTDAQGHYELIITKGWSGTVTPSKTGRTFLPVNRPYINVQEAQADQNYAEHIVRYPISGVIRDGDGSPVAHVTVTANNGGISGVTNSQGQYSVLVPEGWSGAVTPSQSGFSFAPHAKAFVDVQSAQAGQDFLREPLTGPIGDTTTMLVHVNTPKFIELTGKDSSGRSSMEPLGEILTFEVVTAPQHGTLTGTAPTLVYTPNQDYQGPDSFTFRASAAGLEGPQATIQLNVAAWEPPFACPTPPFGLTEVAPARPDPWTSGVPGYYYVDKTHPNATDTNNPYGYPGKPRAWLPDLTTLQPGDVIEIAAGEYMVTGGPKVHRVRSSGTVDQPIFIRGTDPANPPVLNAIEMKYDAPSYIIYENLELGHSTSSGLSGLLATEGAHHIAVRNCRVCEVNTNGISITADAHHILISHCIFHDNGDWLADYDQDYHGVLISGGKDVWVLDSEMYHNSGNGLQINGPPIENNQRIFVCRNVSHHNKQAGLWTKYAMDVVFSQNTSYAARPVGEVPSSPGDGMGCQYDPERVWFLFNHIYDCRYGIRVSTDTGRDGPGGGLNLYMIGNVIHDINRRELDVTGQYPTATGSFGLAFWNCGHNTKHIIGNTVYNADGGVQVQYCDATAPVIMVNNIISGIQEHAITMSHEATATNSRVHHNVFDSQAEVLWLGHNYASIAAFEAGRPTCAYDNLTAEASSLFVSPATGNLRLLGSCAAIDAGTTYAAYQTFETAYGDLFTSLGSQDNLSLLKDIDGRVRPLDGDGSGQAEFDIGAYEHD